MTKRSSSWLVFLTLAVAATTFTVSMTFEDLRIGSIETISVQYFVAGGGAAAIFAAIAMYLWLNERARRQLRAEAVMARNIERSQEQARSQALHKAQQQALAEQPTFNIRLAYGVPTSVGGRPLRYELERDWNKHTGEIRI